MLILDVVMVSTRPGRAGEPIAKWFQGVAEKHGKLEVRWVDLRELGLPVLDEPQHPRLKQYQNEHTQKWSRIVQEADAFVFVTPEYNFFAPPSFVNAVSYLFQEWQYKAAAFVSYGGASGGLRAVQMEKQLLTAMKVMTIPEAVSVPMFTHAIEHGVFKATPHQEQQATSMLNELAKWAEALKPLRGAERS